MKMIKYKSPFLRGKGDLTNATEGSLLTISILADNQIIIPKLKCKILVGNILQKVQTIFYLIR